jgi:hypothetical protein
MLPSTTPSTITQNRINFYPYQVMANENVMASHQVQQDWDMEKALDWSDEYEDDEGYVHGTE